MSASAITKHESALAPRPSAMDANWWAMTKEQAGMLVRTGFLPQSIKSPEQAIAIMMKGAELGVPPMYALSNIVVVQGKPTCSAELMLALVRRDHGTNAIRVKHSDNQSCTVEWKEWGEVNAYTFDIDDAKRAGLTNKGGVWTQYPAAMLRARCISAVCRMAFPESIAGMYVPDELGASVTIRDDGEMEVRAQVIPNYGAHDSLLDACADAEAMIEGEVVDVDTGEIKESEPPTEKQFKYAFALARNIGMSDADLHQFAGVTSLNELTKETMKGLIDRLVALDADMDEGVTDAPAEADIVDWTVLWKRLRGDYDISNRRELEERLGESISALSPQQVWDKMVALQ